jgi:hypothetical protein
MRQIFSFFVDPIAIMVCVFALYGSLFFAGVGQALLLSGFVKGGAKESGFPLVLLLLIPYLVVFFLTYTKVSPVPPRVYLAMLLLAMAWYATVTIICELLLYAGEIPAANDPPLKRNLARAVMHVGWISFIPISFLYRSAHNYIIESRKSSGRNDLPC